MTARAEVTRRVLDAKRERNLTFRAIAGELDADPVWTTAALLGQHPLERGDAERLVALLSLPQSDLGLLTEIPTRGALDDAVPRDPTIYRLYEVLHIYGPAIKALIHEEFGDGIMSAITFRAKVDRRPDPDGDRVQITLEGKFLPYKW